jgi:hypothetical protein
MGREIKRVAIDFDWPINTIWKGFICPYQPTDCKACEGTGHNAETRKLSEDWYGFERPKDKWCHKITQDEVQALIDSSRLLELTHTWSPETGWVRRQDNYVPTAEEVNLWSQKSFGHDAINRWICVETRVKRLGVWGHCSLCEGKGHYWCEDKYEELYNAWESIEPPSGEGFQLWSTTTEGHPMSPVLPTPELLAQWLVENQVSTFGHETTTYESWLEFCKNERWAPTFVCDNGTIKSGVDASS